MPRDDGAYLARHAGIRGAGAAGPEFLYTPARLP